MPERPLSDDELRKLRGMMDEYTFAERRRLLWSQRFRSGRLVLLTVLGVILYMTQLALAILALKGGG